MGRFAFTPSRAIRQTSTNPAPTALAASVIAAGVLSVVATPARAASQDASSTEALNAAQLGGDRSKAGPVVSEDAQFRAWLKSFRADALAQGVGATTLDASFPTIRLIPRVFERDDNQPEFAQSVWTYLDSAVSDKRVADGRENFAANRAMLDAVEEDYGVDGAIIVAIWGLESSYGAIMGDNDSLSALASLAWKSRRAEFFREQLIGALKIIENGYAARDELRGSWAGAMGQTQFIPTTYLAYAIDRDQDGRRDIWSDLGDVFASTANYLSRSRYRAGEPWGTEVRLPADFDYAQADGGVTKAVAEWTAAGVSGARGSLVETYDPNLRGQLIIPAGARGPAFMVFDNFEAILRYNRSTSYALAVGLLADRIDGGDAPLVQNWPREDRALSLSERKRLQESLKQKGFDPGPVDGVIGAGTKRALRDWQKSEGLPADGYASASVLLRLTTS